MQTQSNPNGWSCFPTAVAMLLDEPVSKLIKEIGHDGSDKRPDGQEKGFNDDEIIDLLWAKGYTCTGIQLDPQNRPCLESEPVPVFKQPWVRFKKYLHHNKGILTGITKKGRGHVVTWRDYLIMDPRGSTRVCTIEQLLVDFQPVIFYIVK